MNDTWKIIKGIFTSSVFQNIAIMATVALALANAYAASKLAPLAASQLAIQGQVSADETRITNDEKYIPQFIQTQQQVSDEQASLVRIETKVDSIDSFLRGYK